MHRLERAPDKKSLAYNSYTFGDPATRSCAATSATRPRSAIVHAGGEMFHVYHLHGGGIRWRYNPRADTSFDYAEHRPGQAARRTAAASTAWTRQSIGPGESYTLEIEGGAGGVQQAVGDFLEHCHIAEHYVAGMWSFWRVFNTRQPDLAAAARPRRPAGARRLERADRPHDARRHDAHQGQPRRLGQAAAPAAGRAAPTTRTPRSGTGRIDRSEPGQARLPGRARGDRAPGRTCPAIVPGPPVRAARRRVRRRPAEDPLQPARRPPRVPAAAPEHRPALAALPERPHRRAVPRRAAPAPAKPGDAPTRGPTGRTACARPARPERTFNVTTIQLPIQVTEKGATDPTGKIFVLNKDKADVLAGAQAGRAAGDPRPTSATASRSRCPPSSSRDGRRSRCRSPTCTSTTCSSTCRAPTGRAPGMVYDQSVLPVPARGPDADRGRRRPATPRCRSRTSPSSRPGVWIGVGEGTDDIEIRQIDHDRRRRRHGDPDQAARARATPPASAPARSSSSTAGIPTSQLDNVFWHDHVDGIHGWGKGLVGQLIVEPKGSTYHDPKTGERGRLRHASSTSARRARSRPGLVDGAFREMALWTINDNPVTDSTINLRAAPWADRLATTPTRRCCSPPTGTATRTRRCRGPTAATRS